MTGARQLAPGRRGCPESVVIVSAVSPYPTDAGKKVVLAGLVEYWADRLGPERVHYVLVGDAGGLETRLPVRVHLVERPRSREQLLSLATRTVATGRHAIQESMLYSRRVRRRLAALLEEIDADLEIYDTVRMGQYAEEIGPRRGQGRVIYLDDLFSSRYARMLETLRTRPDVRIDALGEFRRVVPQVFAAALRRSAVQRAVLDIERRLVARGEARSVEAFASCLLVSPHEVATLVTRTGRGNVHALPPVVASQAPARPGDPCASFVFLGLLSLPHNHDAVLAFLSESMPDLVRRLPGCRVHIVGRGATPEILAGAAEFPENVVVEGFVPDLGDLLSRASALLVPLRFGSGIKIKVLEALAHGLPVLSTTVGAEGIVSGPGSGVVVEDDLAMFGVRLEEISVPEMHAELSREARLHHDLTYSREAAYAAYDEVFGVTPSVRRTVHAAVDSGPVEGGAP